MSKLNQPKFKIYSKLGLRLTDHPKIFLKKLGSKKWQSLYSNSKQPRKILNMELCFQQNSDLIYSMDRLRTSNFILCIIMRKLMKVIKQLTLLNC